MNDASTTGSSHEPPSITIKILEQDGTAFDIHCLVGEIEIEIITDLQLEGTDLILFGLHIDGPGSGILSPALLRQTAREFGRHWGVERVIMHGGQRTTGVNPGHVPRKIVISVN